MQNRSICQFCFIMLGLTGSTTQARAQVEVQFSPTDSNDTYSLTASNLPKTGVAVIWQSTGPLAKGANWSAAHAFPSNKVKLAALPVQPRANGSSFFKLSWQDINLQNSLIWLPPGDFLMGSPEKEAGRYKDEGPTHNATIPHGFWMDRYEVTQEQFMVLMDSNPSSTDYTSDLPVNKVTWHEAREYCKRLTKQQRTRNTIPSGYLYR
ncbi:MAG: formylglycine-generating enzyme family protein, partial [Verrucomicrobiota bacterium]|nr:formylglycine-generating enzyme family protein [Verrucomicrobiota bacterium]